MTYSEWLSDAIPVILFLYGTATAGCILIYNIDKFFCKHKRQIALWIGKHIYHEDWSVEQ